MAARAGPSNPFREHVMSDYNDKPVKLASAAPMHKSRRARVRLKKVDCNTAVACSPLEEPRAGVVGATQGRPRHLLERVRLRHPPAACRGLPLARFRNIGSGGECRHCIYRGR